MPGFKIRPEFQEAAEKAYAYPALIDMTEEELRSRKWSIESYARRLEEHDEKQIEYLSYARISTDDAIYSRDFSAATRTLRQLMKHAPGSACSEEALCEVIDYIAKIYPKSAPARELRGKPEDLLRHEEEKYRTLKYLATAIARIEALNPKPSRTYIGPNSYDGPMPVLSAEKRVEMQRKKIELAESLVDELDRLAELERKPPALRSRPLKFK